jgi:hypothetical protein
LSLSQVFICRSSISVITTPYHLLFTLRPDYITVEKNL